jgi:hypothetical protein
MIFAVFLLFSFKVLSFCKDFETVNISDIGSYSYSYDIYKTSGFIESFNSSSIKKKFKLVIIIKKVPINRCFILRIHHPQIKSEEAYSVKARIQCLIKINNYHL